MKVIDNWLKQLHDEVGSDLFVTVDAPPCIKVHGKIKPIATGVGSGLQRLLRRLHPGHG